MERLVPLAEKLGVTVQYLWAALLRQAPVDGVSCFLGAALCVLYVAGVCGYGAWIRKHHAWYKHDLPFVMAVALALPTLMMLGHSIYWGLTAFLNPEYWALHEVLGALGH